MKIDLQTPLRYQMVNPDDLTDVARKTRSELAAAFAARFYSRVWDNTAADPSFFRDATVMLTPPFHSGKHLDMLKLVLGDDSGLPTS